MSIHRLSQQHSDPTGSTPDTSGVVRRFALNPLWMVTFAAGLLFGMLVVLLTSG